MTIAILERTLAFIFSIAVGFNITGIIYSMCKKNFRDTCKYIISAIIYVMLISSVGEIEEHNIRIYCAIYLTIVIFLACLGYKKSAILFTVIFAILFIGACKIEWDSITYSYDNLKWQNTSTITVYASNGMIAEQYVGKTKIEKMELGYILFKDEDGKMHEYSCVDGTIVAEQDWVFTITEAKDSSTITICGEKGLIFEKYHGKYEIQTHEPGFIAFNGKDGKVCKISTSGTITVNEE